MTSKSICETTEDIKEYIPAKIGKNGWVFQKFHVMFRDLMNSGGADPIKYDNIENCRIIMCLKGKFQICAQDICQKESLHVFPGGCCLQYHPGGCPCLKCTHCNRAQLLELVCPVHQLVQLVGDTHVGHQLKTAMEERRPLYIYHPMTPCIHQAMMSLRQVLEESDTGVAPLVLARTLEMLWLFTHVASSPTCNPISAETRKAMEKARDILEAQLADPPGLEKLAAEVGMSLSKLKQVFPKIYGMPPYSYLRQMRMERAMKLLSQKGMSVTDAAFDVGYSNLSHFSKVFTAHFGFKPSKLSFIMGENGYKKILDSLKNTK